MELFSKLKIKNAIKQKILRNNSIQISELQTLFLNADHQTLKRIFRIFNVLCFRILNVSQLETFNWFFLKKNDKNFENIRVPKVDSLEIISIGIAELYLGIFKNYSEFLSSKCLFIFELILKAKSKSSGLFF